MRKYKPEIITKKLSWEYKRIFQKCDIKKCNLEGKYKAPKSVLNIREYYFFCLRHVKEYNKSWDYYKGMTVDQIETSIREDVIWNRPSWPTKGTPKNIIEAIDKIVNNNYNIFNNDRKSYEYLKNKVIDQNITLEEQKIMERLDILPPISLEKIKSSYKKMVKKYHFHTIEHLLIRVMMYLVNQTN